MLTRLWRRWNASAGRGVVEAAGGLVWRSTPRGRELALIHRPKYDDWSLPKGKLDPGESWQAAALREVIEETGFTVDLQDFAGCTSYRVRGGTTPKVVLYWHMALTGNPDFRPHNPLEVDELRWLTPPEALAVLSYDYERRLLQTQIQEN
ncbi:MAG: NUDIX hydrolase [Candidatus Competibacteraceae bacterium]|nr:NUDIX hydrolase [Candidatus Competibacteraceae bacterium]